jgi:multiple sugar transport system permease protein
MHRNVWFNKALLVAARVATTVPLWFLFTGSLQDIMGVFIMPPRVFPRTPTLENYAWVVGQASLLLWAWNTTVVLVASIAGATLTTLSGAYSLAFYRWPKWVFVLLISGLLIPQISLVIPRFVVMRQLGLTGTLLSVIVTHLYFPVGLILSRSYFAGLPVEYLEAARIDGATEVQILVRIIAPIATPIVVTLALLSGMGTLLDYLWQMLQLQRETVQTLLVGITRIGMKRGGDIGVAPLGRQMAGAIILVVPIMTVFGLANRRFTAAATGGIKA